MFVEKVSKVLDEVAPIKIVQRRKHFKNWMNEEVKVEIKKDDSLREKARVSKQVEDWAQYRTARNCCVKLLCQAKSDVFKIYTYSYNRKKTSKNMFRLTNEVLERKTGNSPQQIVQAGKLLRKPIDITNALIDFYNTKVKSSRNPHRFLDQALNSWTGRNSVSLFTFRDISLEETNKLISSLSNSTALGHKGLYTLGIKSGQVSTGQAD